MKKLACILSILLALFTAAEEWQTARILDIGRAGLLFGDGHVATELGIFNPFDGNSPSMLFDGNKSGISSGDGFVALLSQNGRADIFSETGDSLKFKYTIGLFPDAKGLVSDGNLLVVLLEKGSRLLISDSFSSVLMPGFNIENISCVISAGSAVVSLFNGGAFAVSGSLEGGRYVRKNTLETGGIDFLFMNDFGRMVGCGAESEMKYYSLRNDSIYLDFTSVSPRAYTYAIPLDTLFALGTDDYLYLVDFSDTFSFSVVDSIAMGSRAADAAVYSDSFFALSDSKLYFKQLGMDGIDSIGFSKSFDGVLAGQSRYFIFSGDSIYSLDSVIHAEAGKEGFLFQKDFYSLYDDSSVLFPSGDFLKIIKAPFIPSSAAVRNDSICFSSHSGMLSVCDSSGDSFAAVAEIPTPVYDVCPSESSYILASGFYGICTPDDAGGALYSYGESGLVNEVKPFGNGTAIGVGNSVILFIDSFFMPAETIFDGEYLKMKSERNALLIITADSIVRPDSSNSSIVPFEKAYSGIEDASVMDTTAVIILSGGSTLLLSRNFTSKKEDEPERQKSQKAVDGIAAYDLSGRIIEGSKMPSSGIYFLYNPKEKRSKKILILR